MKTQVIDNPDTDWAHYFRGKKVIFFLQMLALIVKMIMLTMMIKMILELYAQMIMCPKVYSPDYPASRLVRASDDDDDADTCIDEIKAMLCKQWPWRDELWNN